ncbi:MAG: hypothetical protein ACI8Y6_002516 [Brevundimonas sp.]|jgi:hypothetical protein|tara:strand:+ start:262 stop:573 length:312 start_codon:yes stop_codon:yes gene_type:complete
MRMDDFDKFETQLRGDARDVLTKYSDRVLHLERYRPWLIGLGALGALIVALSRLDPTGTPGLVALIAGVILAFVSAALVGDPDPAQQRGLGRGDGHQQSAGRV